MAARVSVVMGSDSDWPVMEAAVTVLDEFGVAWEADVVSGASVATKAGSAYAATHSAAR